MEERGNLWKRERQRGWLFWLVCVSGGRVIAFRIASIFFFIRYLSLFYFLIFFLLLFIGLNTTQLHLYFFGKRFINCILEASKPKTH